MVARKTHEQFVEEVLKLGNGEYEVLSNYINSRTRIDMLHIVCNTNYKVKPNEFMQGQRCPKCNKGKGGLPNKGYATFRVVE